MPPSWMKVNVQGDHKVGKTCLAMSCVSGRCPSKYVPNRMDIYHADVMVNGKPAKLGLWDTTDDTCKEEVYDKLRPSYYMYPRTDVFLLCFAVDNQESLENVTAKWLPEVVQYVPGVAIILVATKIDLRRGENSPQCISYDEGYDVAKKNHMYYAETSALTQEGVKDLFDLVFEFAEQGLTLKKSHKGSGLLGRKQKLGPMPPIMPRARKPPWIEIQTSVYGDQLGTALKDPQTADVIFLVEGVKQIKSHRVILCSASNYFCEVFGIAAPVEDDAVKIPFKFTRSGINEGKVAGLSSIAEVEDNEGHQVTQISVSEDISFSSFTLVLEFLYTGLPIFEEGVDAVILNKLKRLATIFHLPLLADVANNIENDENFLNPSIGTYLNDRMGQRAKDMFLGKETFSDVKFNVQETIVPAHKVMLMPRCDVMARMFGGQFSESSKGEVMLQDEDQECFMALLEYFYTDHAPIEEGDSVGILTLADRYGQERFKNLCELYITKEVDMSVRDHVAKADIDVIGLLIGAQVYNATQLANWCLHFISTNYLAFTERSEFSQLDGENLEYIEKNRWPPVSYLEELKEYEALVGEEKKKEESCKVM